MRRRVNLALVFALVFAACAAWLGNRASASLPPGVQSVAVIDSASVIRSPVVSTKSALTGTFYGPLCVSFGINFELDTVLSIYPTTSNGATAVVLLAGSGSTIVLPTHLQVLNNSASAFHTVSLLSSGGAIIAQELQGPQTTWEWVFYGDCRTVAGEGLSFKIDTASGAVTDCTVNGWSVRH